ncbi:hypothetical protein CNMCM5623_004648 [Aspergillus felis]|uniref:GIT Spa2 homology (SHD) domain-containing protein n=1 Tax=Aspergillus felis TaxID=1287682 RepID=A0A8H6QMK2_9EURO|nr:hypothetical protein CNMCM5623_004648 [Aspergillus felis]KAF7175946.1 hypothetical protein CNMCM7691_000797 [Aspergillus felis]
MNPNPGTMSPVSVDGSDWSGINQYQKSEPPFSPTFSTRNNLATPPTSGTPSGLGPNNAGAPNGSTNGVSDAGNPSPPSSVAARSSSGTLAEDRSKRHKQMEEVLGQHYLALRRFLNAAYRDERANSKSNKARDKLLRLSATQFQELSTDVYDELLRRQQAMPSPGRPGPPRPDVPPFLPPREDFHEKRNQARQKLASLQHQRFRDLATDVFCELERRYPQFPARESRRASPAPSLRGRPPNGYPPNGYGPNGYPPPPGSRRSQSRGPPSRMGRGYPSGGPPGSPMGGFPPRQGSLGGPPSVNGDVGPQAKSFQSNTIVPNKSIMVEDDDDAAGTEDDYDARSDAFALDGVLQSRRGTATTLGEGERKLLAETQSQASALQEKVNKLEELLKEKDEELSKYQKEQDKVDNLEELIRSKDEELAKFQEEHQRSQATGAAKQEWDALKVELESKISQAEELNASLQLELEKMRTEHDVTERDLRNQLDEASRQSAGDAGLQARFSELEIKHRDLQAELREQQHVTEEVRREAATFLMEMKALSEQAQSRWEHEERLSGEVQRLEEELQQWKTRYAKAKTQLRHLRASSGISETRPGLSTVSQGNGFMHDDGLVKDIHVTKFQISIDELLRVARSDEYQLVMHQIKGVILAVRHVLNDIESTQNPADGLAAMRTKATRKVSATANNMITAAKNFVRSNGLSPVSLLDAAASHLSTAVIELVRLVKIRPTPEDELNENEEERDQFSQMKSPDYFSVAPSQSRMSNNDSIYSAMSDPSNRTPNGTHSHLDPGFQNGFLTGSQLEPEDHELQELKLYIEDQTDGLVQSIQALVASVRAEDVLTTINTHVSAISSIVSNVSSSTEHFINKSNAGPVLRERSGPILQTLNLHRTRLLETTAEGEDAVNIAEHREVIKKLPPLAFEIARETKELVHRLDLTDDNDSEDDFR